RSPPPLPPSPACFLLLDDAVASGLPSPPPLFSPPRGPLAGRTTPPFPKSLLSRRRPRSSRLLCSFRSPAAATAPAAEAAAPRPFLESSAAAAAGGGDNAAVSPRAGGDAATS
ncbi:unnamed protein product, partial [Ectocarpus sp. 12 AP-2014]